MCAQPLPASFRPVPSAELGASPATVGRRMLALEQVLARSLFVRRQTGYELTEHGRALLAKALAVEVSALASEEWLEADDRRATVRISAGTWTANFFAENFARLWTPSDPFRIAFTGMTNIVSIVMVLDGRRDLSRFFEQTG